MYVFIGHCCCDAEDHSITWRSSEKKSRCRWCPTPSGLSSPPDDALHDDGDHVEMYEFDYWHSNAIEPSTMTPLAVLTMLVVTSQGTVYPRNMTTNR